MIFDRYDATVLLWAGTDRERKELVQGSRERKLKHLRPSDRTIRAFILAAYRRHAVPVRILNLNRQD